LRALQGDNAMMVPSLTLPREDAMQPFRLMALLALVAFVPTPAMAQDVYAGKTLKIIVGLEAGGTVDTMARLFVSYLRRHIPGNPLVVIQNMPNAARRRHQLRLREGGARRAHHPVQLLGSAGAGAGRSGHARAL
jgi:hypothetical protein